MKNILKTLVEFPSITKDREANHQAIEWIDRFLSEHGMHVKRFEFNGFESLVATTQKTQTPKVLLAAHIDVVPAPKELFTFREKDGRYMGRGVFDMKFAIAAYLKLVDELNGSLHNYDFGLMITSDEEVGGANGVHALVNEGYLPEVVILPDAGDTPDAWKLEKSAKGMLALEITTHGKSAHGSRPWAGDSAIDKMVSLLCEVRDLFKDQGPDTNTLTIGTINGGEAWNSVPTHATSKLDIRVLTDNDAKKLKKDISAICQKYGADMLNPVPFGHANLLDKNNPYVKKFISQLNKVVKNFDLVESDSHGSSDARHFAKAKVPCIVVCPPGDGYHADNEWVSKEGLEELHDVLKLYVQKVASIDGKSSKV